MRLISSLALTMVLLLGFMAQAENNPASTRTSSEVAKSKYGVQYYPGRYPRPFPRPYPPGPYPYPYPAPARLMQCGAADARGYQWTSQGYDAFQLQQAVINACYAQSNYGCYQLGCFYL